MKICRLETLSLLRGKDVQQIIFQEKNKMPITTDIREDLRYQQGVEIGIEVGVDKERSEVAEKLFKRGMDIMSVQEITNLSLEKLKGIFDQLKK